VTAEAWLGAMNGICGHGNAKSRGDYGAHGAQFVELHRLIIRKMNDSILYDSLTK
jgi:hypothetical protein